MGFEEGKSLRAPKKGIIRMQFQIFYVTTPCWIILFIMQVADSLQVNKESEQ